MKPEYGVTRSTSSFFKFYDSIISMIHFLISFIINIFSAMMIIINSTHIKFQQVIGNIFVLISI